MRWEGEKAICSISALYTKRNELSPSERERREVEDVQVILSVLVESKLSNRSKRELLLRPGLGQIEDVVSELLSLFRSHDLNVEGPRREFSSFNRFEQVSSRVVGSGSSGLGCLVVGERLDTLIRLVVELNVNERSILLDHLVSVSRVTVHESVSVGSSSSVREEDSELME